MEMIKNDVIVSPRTPKEYDLLKVGGSVEGTTGNPPGWIGSVVDGVPKVGASFNGTTGWYTTRVRFPTEGMTEIDLVRFVKNEHKRLVSIARAEKLSGLLDDRPISREDRVGLVRSRLFNTYLVDFTHRRFSIKVDSRGFVELSAVSLVGVTQLDKAAQLLNTLAKEIELMAAIRES